VQWVGRHAALVLAVCIAITAISLVHVRENLTIDTNTTEMISEDVAFRRNDTALKRAFPHLVDTIVAVVDAPTPEQADEAAARLSAWLRADAAHFRTAYAPGAQSFFRENGLLYLSVADLADLADRLAEAQPLIGMLAQDPTLRGLADIVTQVAERAPSPETAGLATFLGRMRDVIRAMQRGDPTKLSWLSLLAGDDANSLSGQRFVIAQPKLDYGSLQPASAAMTALRAGIRELGFVPANGLTVRLTGVAALDHEELQSARLGGMTAAAASFVMVALFLVAGLRSWRLVLVAVVTLLIGLIWTAAFATLAVGRLNLISVTFAVLFIGLGVDFSIHLCLRYREEMAGGCNAATALAAAGSATGRAIVLSAIVVAAGFLSFVPTDYRGLAELGVISAAGMFLAVVANLTVLPALLTLLPLRAAGRDIPSEFQPLDDFARRHPRAVLVASLAVGAAGLISVSFLRFDFDPIRLKDPRMESVATFFDLARNPRATPYAIDVLTADLDEAAALARQLTTLPEVRDVVTLRSFVPDDQERKLPIIQDIAYFLGPALEFPRDPAPLTIDQRRRAHARLMHALSDLAAGNGAVAEAAADLRAALQGLTDSASDSDRLLRELEDRLTGHLPVALDRIAAALEARSVGLSDLPADLRQLWVSADGRARIEVRPARNPLDDRELRRFVTAVRDVAPNATGTPVIITEAADVVVASFVKATAIAAVLVVFILFAVLRNVAQTLLVLLSLVLAAAFTSLTVVTLGLSLNFANLIALPLLFGLGVSSAIHVVLRWREEGRDRGPVPASTSRGVLYSALTTIASFGSLMISGHRGMVSMGYLLTIAIGYTLITTLLVLPSMVAWSSAGRSEKT